MEQDKVFFTQSSLAGYKLVKFGIWFCRDGDSFDMRKKLPFCVGLLLRLLKKNHRVYVTCTTGFDRSPACVIAYLHWMTDTSLHAAYNFVTGLHSCKPARFFPVILFVSLVLLSSIVYGKSSSFLPSCFSWILRVENLFPSWLLQTGNCLGNMGSHSYGGKWQAWWTRNTCCNICVERARGDW